MAELIAMHGWAYPSLRSHSRSSSPAQKRRTSSSDHRSPSPNKTLLKAKSTNALAEMAGASSRGHVKVPPSVLEGPSETSLSTLRDPRIASTSDLSKTIAPSQHHPDLSAEVATLSDKLIQAINNQTNLDDTLAVTRQELDASRNQVKQLEQEVARYRDDVANGVLVKKADMESTCMKLRADLAEERSQRATIEKEKKGIEQELENLTAALFEEANKMVAAAKMEREAVERKNDQLRAQIKDTEMLLASQQDQLTELKSVMQQMNGDREELDVRTDPSTTAPSSPNAPNPQENINRLLEAMNLSPVTPGSGGISPAPSTSFPHLIKSVCRTDIQAFEDFHVLAQLSKTSKPPSRVGSGSYAGLNVMGLGNLTGHGPNHTPSHSNGSNPSLSGLTAHNSSPNGNVSPRDAPSSTPLKETRFYKRALTEDIEPTLRLDAAPGISWLTRRSVLSSICEGGLIVEPMPSLPIKYSPACSLCGERRQGNENPRTHRFRTSDSDSAQRYSLCVLCLEKVRSCCEFVGYLRLIVDGHVRIGDEEDEREAWEETVRLRERMFWSRIGGGVIPSFVLSKGDEKGSETRSVGLASPKGNGNDHANGVSEVKDVDKVEVQVQSPSPVADKEEPVANGIHESEGKEDDPFTSSTSSVKRVSIGNSVITLKDHTKPRDIPKPADKEPSESQSHTPKAKENLPNGDSQASADDEAQSKRNSAGRSPSPSHPHLAQPPVTPSRSRAGSESGLRVTIPGSFDQ